MGEIFIVDMLMTRDNQFERGCMQHDDASEIVKASVRVSGHFRIFNCGKHDKCREAEKKTKYLRNPQDS